MPKQRTSRGRVSGKAARRAVEAQGSEGTSSPKATSVTPFRERVFSVVRKIPAGRVATYAAVAAAVNCKSARAIGQAMRHNPFAMLRYTEGPPYPEEMVPCHRVISSNLSMGGFSGQTDIHSGPVCDKVRLLKQEGVLTHSIGKQVKVSDASQVLFTLPPAKHGSSPSPEKSKI